MRPGTESKMQPSTDRPMDARASPGAKAALRSSEKGSKMSVLDSVKQAFRKPSVPDFIHGSQVNLLARIKAMKSGRTVGKGPRDGGQLKAALAPALLTSSRKPPSVLLPPDKDVLQTKARNQKQIASRKTMDPPLPAASQKRKQAGDPDDAPSRTKPKSRLLAGDPLKPYDVPYREDQHQEPVSPTTAHINAGNGDDVPQPSAPQAMNDNDVAVIDVTSSSSQTHTPGGEGMRQETPDSFPFQGPNRTLTEPSMEDNSGVAQQAEPQVVTAPTQPSINDERRSSTATTANLTYRDSVFSSCPSVATGLTSPSEISLALSNWRLHTESRSSSFFSKMSPRSSIASTAPSSQFFLYRTLSSGSAGRFEEMYDAAQHPVPSVPKAEPLRSHPTFFGLDLGNAQSAVVVDQMVKMGHCAQERRIHNKIPVCDATQLLSAPTSSAPKELTPITETASDDGASSARKLQLYGAEPTPSGDHSALDAVDKRTAGSALGGSSPSSPESTSRLSDLITARTSPQNQTPATSVTGTSHVILGDVVASESENLDDSLSDITDHTEESLYEAVESFGPVLANNLMLSIIATLNDDVLARVVSRVKALLGDNQGVRECTTGENSTSQGGTSTGNAPPRNRRPTSQRRGPLKRELSGDTDGSEDDGGDDRGKRPKTTPAAPGEDPLGRYSRLACPFYQTDPEGPWNVSCRGPGFLTVHRVKEHLYRTHKRSYCLRCHATFSDEKSLEAHAKAEAQCVVATGPLRLKGITAQHEKALRARKKTKDTRSEAELWVDAYKILFPEVPTSRIPSPYNDVKSDAHVISSNPAAANAFQQYLKGDFSTRLSRRLEERLRLIPGAQSDFVQAQMSDMVRTCIQEALADVPQQLVSRDDGKAQSETQPAPTPTSSPGRGDSHGTSQVGSQFAALEPAEEAPLPPGQHVQEEVTLAEPPLQQSWAAPVQGPSNFSGIFSGTYFADPLGEVTEGFGASNAHHQFHHHHPQHQVFPTASTASGFPSMGYPSAVVAVAPLLSPSLLPEGLSLDGFDFGFPENATAPGAFMSLPDATFVFPPDDQRGDDAEHRMDHYRH